PSGDTLARLLDAAAGPRIGPLTPRSAPVGTGGSVFVQRDSPTAQRHRAWSTVNSIVRSPSANENRVNGRVSGVEVAPLALDSAAASRSWSKARFFASVAASTTMNSWPPLTDRRYQNRAS